MRAMRTASLATLMSDVPAVTTATGPYLSSGNPPNTMQLHSLWNSAPSMPSAARKCSSAAPDTRSLPLELRRILSTVSGAFALA